MLCNRVLAKLARFDIVKIEYTIGLYGDTFNRGGFQMKLSKN